MGGVSILRLDITAKPKASGLLCRLWHIRAAFENTVKKRCDPSSRCHSLSLRSAAQGNAHQENSRLYNALNQWMSQPLDWSHLCHLKTCIWMIIALIHTGSVNLTKWSMYICCRGQFAQSSTLRVLRRIQPWLNNPRINVHRIYKSLIKEALASWS